jgi:hypothetical protein
MVTARHRILLAAPFLATGAALLVYILSGVSLLAAVGFVGLCAALVAALSWRRAHPSARPLLRRTLQAGVVAGGLATLAYDAFRYLLVKVGGYTYWPFDTFAMFGQALLGPYAGGHWLTAAGVAFHVANGVGFGLAYTMCLGHRGVIGGIVWALALETITVTIYPGWLGLKALDEFLQVSIFGHVMYGVVLGSTARFLLLARHRNHAPT